MYHKKLFFKFVTFAVSFLICVTTVFAKNIDEPARICDLFEDTQLSKIVASSLKKNSEEDKVTQTDLDSITSLVANNCPPNTDYVCKLNGIEYLNNLKQLLLIGGDITDLSPLSKLRKLWELQLPYHKHLRDITPIKALTGIKRMNLIYTAIQDINALRGMKQLYWVCLEGTPISDFSVLSTLPKLENCDVPISKPKSSCTIM